MVIVSDNLHIVVGPHLETGKRWGYLVFDRQKPGENEEIRLPAEVGSICHYHACARGGLLFDAFSESGTCIGLVKLDGSDCSAWPIAKDSYCHVGHDPEGRFLFASVDNFNAAEGHHIAAYIPACDGSVEAIRLTDNLPAGRNQICHAHPVLAPDRKSIIYTALGDDDKSHLFQVDIWDLDTDNIPEAR